MKNLFILIPPSEGKKKGGDGKALAKASENSSAIVKKVLDQKQDWAKILGVKDKALAEAMDYNHNILSTPTMPAIERYTGVVYTAIDYPTLKPKAKIFFDKHIRIVSAVFGLVKPTDLIPNYKLKIDKFGADKHWRGINQEILSKSFIVDLLPQAHKKAVIYTDGVAVNFSIIRNNKKVSAGHHGKHIKGRFIRWLAETQCLDDKLFKNFNEDGFCWNGTEFVKNS